MVCRSIPCTIVLLWFLTLCSGEALVPVWPPYPGLGDAPIVPFKNKNTPCPEYWLGTSIVFMELPSWPWGKSLDGRGACPCPVEWVRGLSIDHGNQQACRENDEGLKYCSSKTFIKHQGPISWLCLPPNSTLYHHIFRVTIILVQVLNFCTSCVSEECLAMWSTHAHKQNFPANPWNTLDVSAELPASVCAHFLLTMSRAMKWGPCWYLHHLKFRMIK